MLWPLALPVSALPMPRAGLDTAAVVNAAMQVVDADGAGGLTLAAVAGRLGIAAPSLYKHVASLTELQALVGVRVLEEMTDEFGRALMGRSDDDAVAALMHTYRAYALAHPGRYAAMPLDALHADPATAAAGADLLRVCFAALRGYHLTDAAAVHATRCLRAAAHGFIALELGGGFGMPEEVDETYERLVRMLLASLRHQEFLSPPAAPAPDHP